MARYGLRIGHVQLIAHCEDTFSPQARSLLQAVVSFHGQGKGLADGVTVRFGWSMLTLRRQADDLLICEPDFDKDPFHAVRDNVTCTLAVAAAQAAVVNRLGVEPVDVRFDQKVVVAKGCLAAGQVYLQRSQPGPDDSGWYVGAVNRPKPPKKPESYDSLFVFELLRRRPSLLGVLALPPGYMAVFEGNEVEAVVDPNNKDVWNTRP